MYSEAGFSYVWAETPSGWAERRPIAEARIFPGVVGLSQIRWMVGDFLDWQQNGLIRPDIVAAATAEYFAEQDIINGRIEERCERRAAWHSKVVHADADQTRLMWS